MEHTVACFYHAGRIRFQPQWDEVASLADSAHPVEDVPPCSGRQTAERMNGPICPKLTRPFPSLLLSVSIKPLGEVRAQHRRGEETLSRFEMSKCSRSFAVHIFVCEDDKVVHAAAVMTAEELNGSYGGF